MSGAAASQLISQVDLDALKAERDGLLSERAALIKERDELKAKEQSFGKRLAAKLCQFGIRETATNNGEAMTQISSVSNEPKTPQQRFNEYHNVGSMDEFNALQKAKKQTR
jgi:hypothetical protein